MIERKSKGQSSFELLITLSVGLAILLPVVAIAFIQLANANSSLSAIEAQQAASKISSIATAVGSEGPPAKQVIQVQVPPGVRYIYVGALNNGVGHEVIFVVSSPTGLSYVTSYTPVNVSGNLGGIVGTGSYLVNISATASCPHNSQLPCVYISPIV
jgi:hypothetical protein